MKIKALLYCTKAKPYLKSHSEYEYNEKGAIPETRKRVFTIYQNKCYYYNGKIVTECDFEVETYLTEESWYSQKVRIVNKRICDGIVKYNGTNDMLNFILNRSCLTIEELTNYMDFEKNRINQKELYAIHIKNLHIFDNPRFIQDYSKNENPYNYIENAPSNMMYAYDVKSFNNFEKKILISIKPQEMCRVLNGEQTVLVRKKILKEMLKNEN